MYQRVRYEKLKSKISEIERYLATKGIESFDFWPTPGKKDYWPLRWLMEYCMELKAEYYKRLKRRCKR